MYSTVSLFQSFSLNLSAQDTTMTGNRVFYFRVHDGGHSARKGLHDNVDEFQWEWIILGLTFKAHVVSIALYAKISGNVFVPFFVTVLVANVQKIFNYQKIPTKCHWPTNTKYFGLSECFQLSVSLLFGVWVTASKTSPSLLSG